MKFSVKKRRTLRCAALEMTLVAIATAMPATAIARSIEQRVLGRIVHIERTAIRKRAQIARTGTATAAAPVPRTAAATASAVAFTVTVTAATVIHVASPVTAATTTAIATAAATVGRCKKIG